MAKFNKSDMRYFDIAHRMADKSTYSQIHIGCIFVYKGHIIGSGYNSNKTSPIQKRYNRYRAFKYDDKPVIHKNHAEISCMKSVPKSVDIATDWSKVKAYIYRVSPGKDSKFGLSRPCGGCLKMLKDKGIKHIYYTGDSSYVYEELF